MKKIKLLLSVILLTVVYVTSLAQVDPMSPMPNDESVRHGVLENGMTYYIKANQEPKERASFYIIQNVGALLEEDHQNGLAHFLEHMAFNGTEHFPEKGIIDFLETPTSGTVIFGGRDITSEGSIEVRRRMGMVFQK